MRGPSEHIGGAVMKQTLGQACLTFSLLFEAPMLALAAQPALPGGDLRVLTPGGPVAQCPMKHTDVVVTIRYFETIAYGSGSYEFSFPMVVGPRFIPGAPTTQAERGRSPDTTEVPDASRLTPPGLRPEMRTGHDISLEVRLDAGAT